MAVNSPPRIAVISAVPAAIAPAVAAIGSAVAGADAWNILDDRLLADARANGVGVDERDRMQRLVDHAVRGGADGVLVTCSLYAGVVRSLARHVDVPVLAADDAAFAEIARSDLRRVVLVAPLPEALADSVARLRETLPDDSELTVSGVVAEGAHTAASAEALADIIERAVAPVRDEVDAVLLAQYSLAPAGQLVAERIGLPVYTTPGSAARELAARLDRDRQEVAA